MIPFTPIPAPAKAVPVPTPTPTPASAPSPFLLGTVASVGSLTAQVRFIGGVLPCVVPVSLSPALRAGDVVLTVPSLAASGQIHVVVALVRRPTTG